MRRLAAALLCALVAGCHSCPGMPRIDPSGERIFSAAPPHTVRFQQEPGRVGCSNECQVKVMPSRIVQPVGSEVVLMASVCGQDGFLTANEEVQWLLAPGGVGQFLAVGDRGCMDGLLGAPSPHKVTPTYAIGTTSSKYLHINRGTPTPTDDIEVLRGQAWITVTSPVEGTSHVTAFAPKVYAWDKRQQNATIYWVDAEWSFPPPGINPSGTRHTFTTSVLRHTTHAPVAGWRVRYEIKGGPPAAFAPDGGQVVEVTTNSLGQASAEIFQTDATPGVNTIAVEIIRPGELSSDGTPITVGAGATSQTWGSSQQLSIDKTGPAQANIGGTATYRIEVRNNSNTVANSVMVTDLLTQGMTFVASDPVIVPRGPQLEWPLGDLDPGTGRAINLTVRLDAAGTMNNCATVRAADGATSQDCVATTVMAATLDVQVAGPSTVMVGDQVPFIATITNRGTTVATGLMVVDRFDPGLKHEKGGSTVETSLRDLRPGESAQVKITFDAISPGQQCNRVEVLSENTVRAQGQACVQVAPAGTNPTVPAVVPPPTTSNPSTTTEKPVLSVRKVRADGGGAQAKVGDLVLYSIDVTNTSNVPAMSLKVNDHYDAALTAVRATPNHTRPGNDLNWLIDTLPAGKTIHLDVECKCLATSAKACNNVTVTSQEGARADDAACLEIVAGPSNLSLSVSDLRDPVDLGTQTTYLVVVTNNGTNTERQVALDVTVPDGLTPLPGLTRGRSPNRIVGQTVHFDPLAQIAPGERVEYQVEARGDRVGDRVPGRAELRSAAGGPAVTMDFDTTVQNPTR